MTDAKLCSYPGCAEMATHQCECCRESRNFCEDHGTVGGDLEGDEWRLTEAVPSQCWAHGGFNADLE